MTHSADCKVEGCVKPSRSLGWCNTHYMRHKRGIAVDGPIREYKTFDDPEGHRVCSRCEKVKPESEFYMTPTGGLRRRCKRCIIETL
jgi:hypothetical protein